MNPRDLSGLWSRLSVMSAFAATGFTSAFIPFLDDGFSGQFEPRYLLRLAYLGVFTAVVLVSLMLGFLRQERLSLSKLHLAMIILLPSLLLTLWGPGSLGMSMLLEFLLQSGILLTLVAALPIMRTLVKPRRFPVEIAMALLVQTAAMIAGLRLNAVHLEVFFRNNVLLASGFAVLSIIFGLRIKRREKILNEGSVSVIEEMRSLFSDKFIFMMISGAAAAAGAEMCLIQQSGVYFSNQFGIETSQLIIPGTGLMLSSVLTGRFLALLLLFYLKPEKVLLLFSLIGLTGFSALFVGEITISCGSLFMSGLGLGAMLPSLFPILLKREAKRSSAISGVLAASLPAGMIFPQLMWAASIAVSQLMSFMVPLACMFYITWISIMLNRRFNLADE